MALSRRFIYGKVPLIDMFAGWRLSYNSFVWVANVFIGVQQFREFICADGTIYRIQLRGDTY